MTMTVPPGGFRMVSAIVDLADAATAELAATYLDVVGLPNSNWNSLDFARQALWEKLVLQAQQGQVAFRGVRDPVEGAVTISGDALRGSKPDYGEDALEAGGVLFRCVGVFPKGSIGRLPTEQATASARRATNSPQHGDDFVQEMLRFALTPDGFQSKRELRKHMIDWYFRVRGDSAHSERSVTRWVDRYCPPELPDQ